MLSFFFVTSPDITLTRGCDMPKNDKNKVLTPPGQEFRGQNQTDIPEIHMEPSKMEEYVIEGPHLRLISNGHRVPI